MSLYPITVALPETLIADPNLIAQGSMLVIPIDMTSVRMTSLIVQQASNTQDFSMRAWVSRFEDGIALGEGNYAVMKFTGLPIVIHTAEQTPPDNTFTVLVAPNHYFLNVLNLINSPNYFSFSKTDLA